MSVTIRGAFPPPSLHDLDHSLRDAPLVCDGQQLQLRGCGGKAWSAARGLWSMSSRSPSRKGHVRRRACQQSLRDAEQTQTRLSTQTDTRVRTLDAHKLLSHGDGDGSGKGGECGKGR
jgi:hypothetical protein